MAIEDTLIRETLARLSRATDGNMATIQAEIDAHNGDAGAAFRAIGERAQVDVIARIEAAKARLAVRS